MSLSRQLRLLEQQADILRRAKKPLSPSMDPLPSDATLDTATSSNLSSSIQFDLLDDRDDDNNINNSNGDDYDDDVDNNSDDDDYDNHFDEDNNNSDDDSNNFHDDDNDDDDDVASVSTALPSQLDILAQEDDVIESHTTTPPRSRLSHENRRRSRTPQDAGYLRKFSHSRSSPLIEFYTESSDQKPMSLSRQLRLLEEQANLFRRAKRPLPSSADPPPSTPTLEPSAVTLDPSSSSDVSSSPRFGLIDDHDDDDDFASVSPVLPSQFDILERDDDAAESHFTTPPRSLMTHDRIENRFDESGARIFPRTSPSRSLAPQLSILPPSYPPPSSPLKFVSSEPLSSSSHSFDPSSTSTHQIDFNSSVSLDFNTSTPKSFIHHE